MAGIRRKPQEVANTAWACATLGYQAPSLFDEIERSSQWLVDGGTPQAVANTAWACATLGYQAPALFAEIQKRRPDLAEILTQPFYFDARGQQLPGRPSVQKVPLITLHDGRPYALQKRAYIRFAQRFDDVPRLTDIQFEALDLLDALCADPEFQFSYEMEPGQIVIGLNHMTLHARDSYEDFDNLDDRRHMVRQWLGLPNGPSLPDHYRDTREFGPLFDITQRKPLHNP